MKKILLVLLVVLLSCSMLFAAGGKEVSGSKTDIVISEWVADAAANARRQIYIDEPLNAAFPDINIEVRAYNDRQSLQIEVAGGGGPDILALDGPTVVAEYAKANRVLDLTSYAEEYGWRDMFYDWAYDSALYQGKLYSLPTNFQGMFMYYNMDVLRANGWEIPETKDQLIGLMEAMQGKGIIPITFGNADYQGAVDWLYSTFMSSYAGPDAVKAAVTGEIKFTDPLIRDSIQLMVDWWKAGYIGDRKSQSITQTDSLAFFAEGRAGMMINGTWASRQLLATYPESNWQAEMVPELREGVGRVIAFATGGGYAINASSRNPDKAAEILNFLYTSLDRHYKSIREAGYQPYPLRAFDIDNLQGIDNRLLYVQELLKEAQENDMIGYASWTFFPAETRNYMNENTDALFLDILTVDRYLAKAQETIDAAIAAGTVPVFP